MGFLRDIKQLHDTGVDLQKASGRRTGFAGMRDAVSQANQTVQGLQQAGADNQRLMATGTPATGVVRAIRDTGTLVNMHPQIEFDLDVTLPGQPAYPVTVRQVISPVSIPSVQPGAGVALKVDPMDANAVLILV